MPRLVPCLSLSVLMVIVALSATRGNECEKNPTTGVKKPCHVGGLGTCGTTPDPDTNACIPTRITTQINTDYFGCGSAAPGSAVQCVPYWECYQDPDPNGTGGLICDFVYVWCTSWKKCVRSLDEDGDFMCGPEIGNRFTEAVVYETIGCGEVWIP